MNRLEKISTQGMHQIRLITVFVCALFCQNLLAAAAMPGLALPEFKAQYGIEKYGIKLAEATYQLSYTQTGYKFSQNTELHGVANMFRDDSVNAISYVDKVGDTLLLKKHRYVQTGKEKNRNEDFSINWDNASQPAKGTITGVVRSKQINLETRDPVWEVLSFQIPLMIDARKDKKTYPYKALLKGKIDTYNFVLTASKKITFADKEYQLLQLVRSDPRKNRQLHIWVAPELHNLPVIVENYRKGKQHSRMQLESVQFNNGTPIKEQEMDSDEF